MSKTYRWMPWNKQELPTKTFKNMRSFGVENFRQFKAWKKMNKKKTNKKLRQQNFKNEDLC